MSLFQLTRSLSGRLLLASMVVLPIFVFTSGVALDRAFGESQAIAEQERLRTQMYLLLGATEATDQQLWLPESLQEPRFNQPESGLYARISDANTTLWQSESALMAPLPAHSKEPIDAGREQFQQLQLGDEDTAVYSFDVLWELGNGQEKGYRFQIFHDQSALLAERHSYQEQLWRWLGSMTIVLIALQWGILRWGLKPFTRLANDLQQLQSGHSLKLNESYPAEINPVVQNLNQVIAAERQQRDRYRNTLSDLAHSLKTPLAVMRSTTSAEHNQASVLDDQISRMDDIIRHQLQRSVSEPSAINAKTISIKTIVERLLPALAKVYADKNLTMTSDIDPNCEFSATRAT